MPVRTQPFPSWPIAGRREEELLLEVLHSGQWSELSGTKVDAFTRKFAAFQDAAFGVALPTGTLALEVALLALGVGSGDEVITTAYTFIATASAALSVGARPIFADIDPRTNNLDPANIEQAITTRTKAIVPVHLGGHPADMDAILDIAGRHGIHVVEDAAQAWGSQWRGKGVGALGDLGIFSFQSSKNLNAGEGGALLTNDQRLYDLAWSLHNVGRVRHGGWYQHEILGRNLRLSEWNGAVLLAQLERLPMAMQRRSHNAEFLTRELDGLPGLTPVALDPRAGRSSWHIYQLRYDPSRFHGRSRDQFLTALRAEGIPCSGGYVPLVHTRAIRDTLRQRFGTESLDNLSGVPCAERASETSLWLPQTLLLGSEEDMSDVVEAITKIAQVWSTGDSVSFRATPATTAQQDGSGHEIRSLTPDDADQFWEFRLEALRESPLAFAESVDEHKSRPPSAAAERLRTASADLFVLGAFVRGRLIGTAGFLRNLGTKVRHKGRLWGFYVEPAHRGRGIGRDLLTELIARARTLHGLREIALTVATTQTAALGLYESLGFERFGLEPCSLIVDDVVVDEEHRVLMLDRAPQPGA